MGEGVTESSASCPPGSSRIFGPHYKLMRSDPRGFFGGFAAVAVIH